MRSPPDWWRLKFWRGYVAALGQDAWKIDPIVFCLIEKLEARCGEG